MQTVSVPLDTRTVSAWHNGREYYAQPARRLPRAYRRAGARYARRLAGTRRGKQGRTAVIVKRYRVASSSTLLPRVGHRECRKQAAADAWRMPRTKRITLDRCAMSRGLIRG
ncbi:hypothetical protein MRX96_002429 [Rhipicephalus microplus]